MRDAIMGAMDTRPGGSAYMSLNLSAMDVSQKALDRLEVPQSMEAWARAGARVPTTLPSSGRRLHLFAHIGDKDTDRYFEMTKSVCYAHAVKVTFEEVGVEEPALDLDDDASTVVGDNRARIDNEWETEKARVYQSKQHDEPFWFEHASVEEKRAYASMKVRPSIAIGRDQHLEIL